MPRFPVQQVAVQVVGTEALQAPLARDYRTAPGGVFRQDLGDEKDLVGRETARSTPIGCGIGGSSAASAIDSARSSRISSCTTAPSVPPTSSEKPAPVRSALSFPFPKRRGFPCSSLMSASSRTSRSAQLSKAPSLKTGQFCQICTNAAPLCWAARRRTVARCAVSVATLRATKVAPAPRAMVSGLKGRSTVPYGLDLVRLPSSLVGDACPLVRP